MINYIQTINRFLASVDALMADNGAKESSVSEYYLTHYVYPIRDSFAAAREFCLQIGLVRLNKEQLYLNDAGKTYLDLGEKLNKTIILEPNIRQKEYLSRKALLAPKVLDRFKRIMYHFDKMQNGCLFLSKTKVSELEDQPIVSLFIQLGVLVEHGEMIEINPQYMDLLEIDIATTAKVISPAAFEKSEAQKKEISTVAEQYVLKSEHKRLQMIGANKQSKKLKHVALVNIAAGYDIASYNDGMSRNYDRFIEVKAGRASPIRFFLSRNEYETAKRLKSQYYIYYVYVKDKKPVEIYVIHDPVINVMNNPKYVINSDVYEISEK